MRERVPHAYRLARGRGLGLGLHPLVHTASAKAGMKRATGSLSSNAPSSHSIIAATDVIGFVIE